MQPTEINSSGGSESESCNYCSIGTTQAKIQRLSPMTLIHLEQCVICVGTIKDDSNLPYQIEYLLKAAIVW